MILDDRSLAYSVYSSMGIPEFEWREHYKQDSNKHGYLETDVRICYQAIYRSYRTIGREMVVNVDELLQNR